MTEQLIEKHKTEPIYFKSVYPEISCPNDIDELIGTSFQFQHMFDKRTTPWEISHWDNDELMKFEIDPDKIDRLYYIYYSDHGESEYHSHLIARVVYKNRPLYVELVANCGYTGFDDGGTGRIYISWNANVFMKTVLTDECPIDLIYDLLEADGVKVDRISKYDTMWRMKFTNNVPVLKFLCTRTVSDSQMPENHYRSVLPPILADGICDYVNTEAARYAYENDFSD